jgi:hypothetical protein
VIRKVMKVNRTIFLVVRPGQRLLNCFFCAMFPLNFPMGLPSWREKHGLVIPLSLSPVGQYKFIGKKEVKSFVFGP